MDNVTTTAIEPSANGDGRGRDQLGRFVPGNTISGGNPHMHAVAAWRAALVRCVTPEDLSVVIGKLVSAAKDGERWAVSELLDRCLGQAQQAITVEGPDGPAFKILAGIDEELI